MAFPSWRFILLCCSDWQLAPDIRPALRDRLGQSHENTDPPHPVALLRSRRHQPGGCYTAEKRDELAPSQ
jgi:hypothetical protein